MLRFMKQRTAASRRKKLADRLRKLLGKSHAAIPQGRQINPEDIDLSIFNRIQWLRFKPRVEQHKTELLILKQNILMVMVMYRLGSGCVKNHLCDHHES